MNRTIEVAVIGVGRMGRHHARIYAGLPDAKLVAVVDADEDRAGTVADERGCDFCASIDELVARYPNLGAVSVAVPTVNHVAVAGPLLKRKIACLVEKPLAPSVAEARALRDLAAQCGAVLRVGHTERFNPAVRAVAAMGITPRYICVDRVSPMTFRSLDVGVVMDLMIHDIDVVLMLARSPLVQTDAIGVAVLGEHEDVANARLVFEDGCVANLTASRLALKTERKLRLVSEQAYVSLDYAARKGVAINKSDNSDALAMLRNKLAAGADLSDLDYSELVNVRELTMELAQGEEDPLTAELMSFLSAARQGGGAAADGEAGLAAVETAQRVVDSIRAHRWTGLPGTRV